MFKCKAEQETNLQMRETSIKILLVAISVQLVAGGGDNACDEAYLPFNKTDLFDQVNKVGSVFSFLNTSATDILEDIVQNPEASNAHFVAIVTERVTKGFELLKQSGFNLSEHFLKSYSDDVTSLLSLSGSVESIQDLLKAEMSNYDGIVAELVFEAIAFTIGLDRDVLIMLIENPMLASYPWNCVIDDIAFAFSLYKYLM